MKTPHKHAELIKAWADGAVIQFWGEVSKQWFDTNDNFPSWDDDCKYRVKPEPKPDRIVSVQVQELSGKTIIVGLNTPDNLKLIFDGETGELKDAVVL